MGEMKSGTIFEQRQIFTANVYFSDGEGVKSRPILIISHNKHNISNEDLICCPITSNVSGHGRVIYPEDYELNSITLPVPQSEVKTKHPMFIHKSKLQPLKTGRIKIKKDFIRKVIMDIDEAIAVPS